MLEPLLLAIFNGPKFVQRPILLRGLSFLELLKGLFGELFEECFRGKNRVEKQPISD
jgi:hypothetical protein